MQKLIPIGFALVLLGMLLLILGSFSAQKADTKVAVGGFIGFIPFGFANDKRLLYLVIGVSVAFFVIWAARFFYS